MSDDDRRYSRDEVTQVLRKVAERSPALALGEGLTREELLDVVSEVGLDPVHVDGALAELTTQHKTQSRLLGMRQYALVRRQVPGALDAGQLQRANKLINREVGIIGASEIDEEGLSWFGRHVSVAITQERGGIAVHLEERFHNTVRARLFGGTILAFMGGLLTLVAAANEGMEPLGIVIAALLPVLVYAGLRITHRARVLGTERRLERLGDQITLMLGEPQ